MKRPEEWRSPGNEATRKMRARRRAAGQCIACSAPSQTSRCGDCKVKEAQRAVRREERDLREAYERGYQDGLRAAKGAA